jgi:Tfp pilus assembly protein PilV
MKTQKQFQKGIGLIEVLIAAVIFALGSLALVQLQGKFFKNSSAANARSVAMSIAQEKLEDLRGTAPTSGGFDTIATNAGGIIANGNVSLNNATYTRSWTVANFYYDTAGTLLNETTCTSSSICGADTSSVPSSPDQKNVTVTIAWIDTDGSNQTLALDGLINAKSTAAGSTIIADSGGSGESPVVPHTELAAPDVIPTKIDNPPPLDYPGDNSDWDALTNQQKLDAYAEMGYCNVETFAATEAPDPDLDTNPELDNVLVRFTSSKYQKYTPCTFNASNDYTIADINDIRVIKYDDDEFLTINCNCVLAASGAGQDQSGAAVTKAFIGTKAGAANQQSDFCDLCCRDHHENTTGDNVCNSGSNLENCYDPFITPSTDYTSSDHKHYTDFPPTTVATVGDEYIEVCRIKRVSGFYNVFPDWKMIVHNVLVENELNDASEATSYQSYIGTTVNNYLNSAAITGWAATTPDVPVDGTQMMSRSIYVDYMTAAEIATASPSGDTVDSRVPFYEYKTTQLSDWTTDKSSSIDTQTLSPCDPANSTSDACVDSPAITAIVLDNALDKGVFRYDSPAGNIDIVSTMGGSNSGVVSEPAIDPADQTLLSASYTVAFGAGPPAPVRSVKLAAVAAAAINCPATWKVGPNTYTKTSENVADWGTMTLSCSPSSGNTATCEQYAADTNNVSVSVAMGTAALSCTYSNSSTYACGSVSGLSGGSRLDVDGTFTCTIQSSKSGGGLACDLVCN